MKIRQFLHTGSYADASCAADSPQTLDALVCIIPCFNEGLVLGDTLASVLRAGLRPENVLVVDDCSTDATASIAERFGVALLRNQHNQGKSKSIRRAIDHVRAVGACAYLSVLDGDTLVDPDYFRSVVRTFEADPDVVLVCGQPRSRRYNWLTAYRAVEYALSHAIYKQAQHKMGVITVAPGCASTYRMTILPHLEWNPHILTEDADTTVQVYRKGLGRVVYDGHAIVHTQDPNTIHALKGQLRRWYTGLWQVVVCHRVPFGRQRVDAEFGLLAGEALLFSALLLTMPLWMIARPEAIGTVFLLDQAVHLALACGVALKQRRLDIVIHAPLFIVPRILNCLMFVLTFLQIVVFRRGATEWFSPPRYVSRGESLRTIHAGGSDA